MTEEEAKVVLLALSLCGIIYTLYNHYELGEIARKSYDQFTKAPLIRRDKGKKKKDGNKNGKHTK